MHGLWLDLTSAWRQFRRTPGTAAAAAATLAIGIGATAAVFSFLAAVMTAAAPVRDMERRVALWSNNRAEAETKNAVSMGDFLEWRRRATLLDSIVAARGRTANLSGVDRAVRVGVTAVTPDYFEFFEWRPARGRGFIPADAEPGAPAVVVLSEQFWRVGLGGPQDIVGRTVRIDGAPATVVGVLPRLPAVDGLYAPLVTTPGAAPYSARDLFVFARMRDGVSIEQARAEMDAIGEALERERPETHRGWSVNTRPLREEFLGAQAQLAFGLLSLTVLTVLLVCCVNVANLLIARGVGRQGELAVRVALGASGWRLARQLLIECGVLAAAGAAAGWFVSRWTLLLLGGALPIESPWIAGGVNLRVLGMLAATAVLATIVAGIAPVLSSRRRSMAIALHAADRSGGPAQPRLTRALMAAEVSLAVLLLIIAGLLTRTLSAIEQLDPGFNIENVLTASVTLPETMSAEAAAAWVERAIAGVRSIPGVRSAAATSRVPFAGSRFNPNRGIEIEGRSIADETGGIWAVDYVVTPRLLETLQVSVLAGRTFTDGDRAGGPLVAVVNQAMAARFWPGRPAVGARLRQGDEPDGQWRTVVGVVADIRNDDADQPPVPYLYLPLAQHPVRTMTIVLRSAGDAAAMAAPVRRAVAEMDADQAVYDVRTMREVFEADLAGSRIVVQVLGAFALIALGLAGVGVWGVAAQSAAQRTREIGLRMALGATLPAVVRLMTTEMLVPIGGGLLAGLAGGLAVGRLMRSVLFQVSPADPAAIGAAVAVLAAVGLAATLGPAWRAARVDPAVALRQS